MQSYRCEKTEGLTAKPFLSAFTMSAFNFYLNQAMLNTTSDKFLSYTTAKPKYILK